MARDMVDSLVPPMVERIVAHRLRESVKEQGGLIYKDMLSLRADLAHLRQGVRSALEKRIEKVYTFRRQFNEKPGSICSVSD